MRKLTSWVLYWAGDLLSKLDRRMGWTGFSIYPLYNKLLVASSHIQGDGDGPWYKGESA